MRKKRLVEKKAKDERRAKKKKEDEARDERAAAESKALRIRADENRKKAMSGIGFPKGVWLLILAKLSWLMLQKIKLWFPALCLFLGIKTFDISYTFNDMKCGRICLTCGRTMPVKKEKTRLKKKLAESVLLRSDHRAAICSITCLNEYYSHSNKPVRVATKNFLNQPLWTTFIPFNCVNDVFVKKWRLYRLYRSADCTLFTMPSELYEWFENIRNKELSWDTDLSNEIIAEREKQIELLGLNKLNSDLTNYSRFDEVLENLRWIFKKR